MRCTWDEKGVGDDRTSKETATKESTSRRKTLTAIYVNGTSEYLGEPARGLEVTHVQRMNSSLIRVTGPHMCLSPGTLLSSLAQIPSFSFTTFRLVIILISGNGAMDEELDYRLGTAARMMRAMSRKVMEKSRKTNVQVHYVCIVSTLI